MTVFQPSALLLSSPSDAVKQQLSEGLASRNSGRTIWISQPHNLYLVPEQARAYLDLMRDKSYIGAFHDPVKKLISENVDLLVSGLRSPLSILDLGPGFPDKTLPIFDFLSANDITFTYFPIDVSETFLDIATRAARERHIAVQPVRCLFEDLPPLLESIAPKSNSRLVILGLTFMNFMPNQIPNLLVPLVRTLDNLVVATEQYPSQRGRDITDPYKSRHAERFNRKLLELLGLQSDLFDYFANLNGHCIEVGFTATDDIPFDGVVISQGTRLVTATSYRYSKDEFRSLLTACFGGVEVIEDHAKSVALAVVSGAKHLSGGGETCSL